MASVANYIYGGKSYPIGTSAPWNKDAHLVVPCPYGSGAWVSVHNNGAKYGAGSYAAQDGMVDLGTVPKPDKYPLNVASAQNGDLGIYFTIELTKVAEPVKPPVIVPPVVKPPVETPPVTPPITPPVVQQGVISIKNPSEIKASGKYKLELGSFTLQKGVKLPSDTTLDVTGSTFTLQTNDETSIFDVSGAKNVNVIGGSYLTGRKNYISFIVGASTIVFRDVSLLVGSGWGFKSESSDGIAIDGFNGQKWYNYCFFADKGTKNLSLLRWNINGGSENESCIRVAFGEKILVSDCTLFCDGNLDGQKKNVAIRAHVGSDFTFNNLKIRGKFGIGPMGGGDGGQNWGVSSWIAANGAWGVPQDQADTAKTMAERQKELGYRLTKVRISNVEILEGECNPNPGTIDCIWDGGSITNPLPPDHPKGWTPSNYCFYDIRPGGYPDGSDKYNTKLPGDVVRPPADIILKNVKLYAYGVADHSGVVRIGENVTLNDKLVPAGVV